MRPVVVILILVALFSDGSSAKHIKHKKHSSKTKQLHKKAANLRNDQELLPENELLPEPVAPSGGMALSYMSKLPVEVDLSQFVSSLNERLTGLENQLASVETSVNERIESVSTDLSSQLRTVETSVNERIESVSTDLTYRLDTVDERVNSVETRASSNEAEIASVRNSVQNLPSRGGSLCQTGFTGCSDCGGEDPSDTTYTEVPKNFDVTFPTAFPGTPTVSTSLNEIHMHAPGHDDYYGWATDPIDVTSTGFTLRVKLIDREISRFYSNWIACYTL